MRTFRLADYNSKARDRDTEKLQTIIRNLETKIQRNSNADNNSKAISHRLYQRQRYRENRMQTEI